MSRKGRLEDIPKPVENPSFEGVQLAPEDWFILSRVDGKASVSDLISISPCSREETLESLTRLNEASLIEMPKAAREESSNRQKSRELSLPDAPQGWPTSLQDFVLEPGLSGGELELELQRYLQFFHSYLGKLDHYLYLGVSRDARAGEIKRRYFKLSKVFHPDRFFRRNTGDYKTLISDIFKQLNDAYKVLNNKRKRLEYDNLLARGGGVRPAPRPQRPSRPSRPEARLSNGQRGGAARGAVRASSPRPGGVASRPKASVSSRRPPTSTVSAKRPLAELLAEAKAAEQSKSYREAVRLYRQALEQRENAELMNRVAECLIRLREDIDEAGRWARKAAEAEPENARYWVALAYTQELQHLPDDAKKSYERALALDPSHRGAQTRLQALLRR